MEKNEVIIDVDSEGEGLKLYGLRTSEGWIFLCQVITQTSKVSDDSWNRHAKQPVKTWSAALNLLDEYPWQHFYPLSVHPDFSALVYEAVVARFKADAEKNPRRLADWTKLCVNRRKNA